MKSLVSTLVLSLLAATAFAQDVYIGKVVVPSGVVSEALEEAERAIQRKDRARAIEIYHDLLTRLAKRPIEAHRAPRRSAETNPIIAGDRFRGVRSHIHALLRRLPEDGLQEYVRGAEPAARKLLDDGRRSGNATLLREAVERYFLTPSGQKAALHLVDDHLARGLVDEARILAQRAAAEMKEIQSEKLPLALARVARTLAAAGRKDELAELAGNLGAQAFEKLTIDGQELTLEAFCAKLVALLPVSGGEAAMAADLRLFSRPSTWSRRFEPRHRSQEQFVSWGSHRITPRRDYYPVVPTLRDGVVYSCDGLKVSARSIFNGQRLWPDVRGPLRAFEGRLNRNLFFEVALDRDLLFAYLEGFPQTRAQKGQWGGFDPIEAIPTRRLVAIDATTGRVRWSHLRFLGRTKEETEFVQRITVNTPPLVVGDTLFVAASYYHGGFRQWLCAFERDTGHLIWKTYVCTGQMELNMFGNPIKESVPGHVVERDGIIYYSTNVGIIAAVEADTGALQWLSAYEQVPIPHVDSQLTKERLPGWKSSRPALWKDKLFIAPSDSYDLYCVDLKDGSLQSVSIARRTYQNRNGYFLGLHEDTLIVAGRLIVGVNPDTLKLKWFTQDIGQDSRSGGFVRGQPAIRGRDLVFTTRSGPVVQTVSVDLRTGKLKDLQAIAGPSEEGHVVMGDEAAVIAGTARIYAYFDIAAVEARLDREIRRSPKDASLRLRLADIRRQKGRFSQAITSFEDALRLAKNPTNPDRASEQRAQMALFTLWLELAEAKERKLEGRASKPEERFEEALRYAPDEARHASTLISSMLAARSETNREWFVRSAQRLIDEHGALLIVCDGRARDLVPVLEPGNELPAGLLAMTSAGLQLQEWGRHAEAADFYQRALERFHSHEFGRTTAWEFASEHIAECIRAGGRSTVYREQDEQARRLLAAAESKKDVAGFRAILQRFPQSVHVSKAYYRLNELLLEQRKWEEALREMQSGFIRLRKIDAPILTQYVRCLEEIGGHDSARQILEHLARHFADQRITGDGGSLSIRDWVRSRLKDEPYASMEKNEAPALKGVARRGEHLAKEGSVALIEPLGNAPAACRSWCFAFEAGTLIAFDAKSTSEVWRRGLANFPFRVLWHDGLLLVRQATEVIAIDPESGKNRWRYQPRDANIIDLDAGHGKAYLLLDYLYGPKQLVLQGLDLRSGRLVQSRLLPSFGSGELMVDASHLLVRSFQDQRALILDALSNQRVGSTFILRRLVRFQPHLNASGLLVAPDQLFMNRGSFQLVGRDPAKREKEWEITFPGENVVNSWSSGDRLALYLRPVSRRGSRSSRRIVVIDTARGKKLCSHDDVGDMTVMDATLHGDALYLRMKQVSRLAGQFQQWIRAVDLRSGHRRWETIPFVGSNIDLEIGFTKDHLLVNRSAGLTSREPNFRGSNLYWFNLKNGRAEDEINLGRIPPRSQGVGFAVRPESLAIQAGNRILFYGP